VGFVPNPVKVPDRKIQKSSEPTVCFLGRWDPQKRVHLMFRIIPKFPRVHFVVIGKSVNKQRDTELKMRLQKFSNVSVLNRILSEEEKSRILEKSWILINTSVREALPVTFLEACAHKVALLSCVNPDRFVSRFGVHVEQEDFVSGLKRILNGDLWKEKGKRGYTYVRKHHEIDKVIDRWMDIYRLHK